MNARYTFRLLPLAALLLAAFVVLTVPLDRDSLWYDEAWTVWAVRDVAPVTGVAPRDAVRGLLTNAQTMIERVRGDLHPPLYFLLLDGLTTAAGESAYVVRLLSSWVALIALAETYALGLRLFDRRTALIAMALLGTASFFVYYGREARMYALLLALAVLSTLVYWHWLRHPSWRWTVTYGLLLAAVLYTHYAGFALLLVHGVYLAAGVTRGHTRVRPYTDARSGRGDAPRRPGQGSALPLQRIFPYVIAPVLFLPWLPVMLEQIRARPDGLLAAPVTTDLANVFDLLRILGGGALVVYLPLLVIGAIRQRAGRGFLLLWLILPPAVLFALNAAVLDVYQVRYVIYVLPAWVLLAAWGMGWFLAAGAGTRASPYKIVVPLVVVIVIVGLQLAAYRPIWGAKPDWRGAALAMIAARAPAEPALTYITPESESSYYDRQYGIKRGVSLDLAWRDHALDAMRDYIAALDTAESIWVVMPSNIPETWYTAALLNTGYTPGYRDGVLNMLYYRFDRADSPERGDTARGLQFSFGDLLRYDGPIGQQYTLNPGGALCPPDLGFTTLSAVDDSYAVGLQLTPKHAPPLAQWDGGLGVHPVQTSFILDECLDIPPDAEPGHYHLRLVVYDWRTVENLPVLETGIPWGEALIIGEVVVEP